MSKPNIPKYPYRRVKPAGKPSPKIINSLLRKDVVSGVMQPSCKPPDDFIKREQKSSVIEKYLHDIPTPKWLLARFERHTSRKVIMNDIITRLRRAPSKKNFRLTQRLLNEMGRRPGGGRYIHRQITQDLINEFQIKKEE